MRQTYTQYMRDMRNSKIENAVASIVEKDLGDFIFWCPTCEYYISKESVWQFDWLSEWDTKERRCKHCFPTKEAMAKALRDG